MKGEGVSSKEELRSDERESERVWSRASIVGSSVVPRSPDADLYKVSNKNDERVL